MESISSSLTPLLPTTSVRPAEAARADINIAHAITNVSNSPNTIGFLDLISPFKRLGQILDYGLTLNDHSNLFHVLPKDLAQNITHHYTSKKKGNGGRLQNTWNDEIINSSPNAIRFLIACGETIDKRIDVNAFNQNGNTALIAAVKDNRSYIVKELLEIPDIDVNIQNQHFRDTALIIAAKLGHTEIVRQLLEKGADVNLMNIFSEDALRMAAVEEHQDIMKLLLRYENKEMNERKQYSLDLALLEITAKSPHTEMIPLLLENGANVNTTNGNHQTPLMIATKKHYTKIINTLLTMDNINLDIQDESHGNTALIYAIESGYTSIVHTLLTHGANIYVRNHQHADALIMASLYDHTDIDALLEKFSMSRAAQYQTREKKPPSKRSVWQHPKT